MKQLKASNPTSRTHIDQRPSSSEKHARNDGYIPSRLRARSEKALLNIEASVEKQPHEDINILLTHMAFGGPKHYPNMLRANSEVRLFREVQGIEIWKQATSRTKQSIWWAFNLSLENGEQVRRAKRFWDHVSYYLTRKSLQELRYVNLPRNDIAYPQKTRGTIHRPQFTLKTPGEKHLWTFAGFLSNPDFLDMRDSLRKVVAQNAPEYLLDNVDEEGPDGEENMRDADEEGAAGGEQSEQPNPIDNSTHRLSPGRPSTNSAPKNTYGTASRVTLVQGQQHHTPKTIPLDGTPLTARDKMQRATTARRNARRMAQRL